MAPHHTWLHASQLSLQLPDGRLLFDALELNLGDGVTALIGDNGSGKSTLLSLLAGERPGGMSGTIRHQGRIVYLPQHITPPRPETTLAAFLDCLPLFDAFARVEQGCAGLADWERIGEQWERPAQLAELLGRFGLSGLGPLARVDQLSGGQLARLALVRLMWQQPDHLLLDEPGNHLDRQGRETLLSLLRGFRGGVLLATHDRQLLELAGGILDLGPWGLRSFTRPYAAYRRQRQADQQRALAELAREQRVLQTTRREAQQRLERHQQRQAQGRRERDRRDQPKVLLDYRADRSGRSGGRLQRMAAQRLEQAEARLDEVRQRQLELQQMSLSLEAEPQSRRLLVCEGLTFAHPGQDALFRDLDLRVATGDRIAICGANGSGKSSLLRVLMGELSPQQGRVQRQGRMVLLDQHLSVLDEARSPLDNFLRLAPGSSRQQAYLHLTRIGLARERLNDPCRVLSGGERVRVALACLLTGPQAVDGLLLDEPTNHLDLAAVETLETVLDGFAGAIVVVSHYEHFLQRIGVTTRLLL